MNQGMTNPPAAGCSGSLDVKLESPAHAGDIHVHPVHALQPLTVAPADVFSKVSKPTDRVENEPVSTPAPAYSQRHEIELVSVEPDKVTTDHAVTPLEARIVIAEAALVEPTEFRAAEPTPMPADVVKPLEAQSQAGSSTEVKASAVLPEEIDTPNVVVVAPIVSQPIPEPAFATTDAAVTQAETAEQSLEKPILPKRNGRTVKVATQASTVVETLVKAKAERAVVPSPVTEAPKNLSKRPRRGIRIKGQE
jgi:hypothetical protein